MSDTDQTIADAYLKGVVAGRKAVATNRISVRPQVPFQVDSDEWSAWISGYRNEIMKATRTAIQ